MKKEDTKKAKGPAPVPVNLDFEDSDIKEIDFDAIKDRAITAAETDSEKIIKRMALYPIEFRELIYSDIEKIYESAVRAHTQIRKSVNHNGIDERNAWDVVYWKCFLLNLESYVRYYVDLKQRLAGESAINEDLKSCFKDISVGEKWQMAASTYINDNKHKKNKTPLPSICASIYMHAAHMRVLNENVTDCRFHRAIHALRLDGKKNNSSHESKKAMPRDDLRNDFIAILKTYN